MPSVRDKLEAERRHQPEAAPPVRPRSTLVAGNSPTPSTRSRAEAVEFAAETETLTPLPKARATGLTSADSFSTGVRSRLTAQRDRAEQTTERPTFQEAADYHLAQHAEEERVRKEREAEREREQEETNRRNRAREQHNARVLNINLAFDQVHATAEERRKILALPAATNASFSGLVSMLLELRSCQTRPDWA